MTSLVGAIASPLLSGLVAAYLIHIFTRSRDRDTARREIAVERLLGSYEQLGKFYLLDIGGGRAVNRGYLLEITNNLILLGDMEVASEARKVAMAALSGAENVNISQLQHALKCCIRKELGLSLFLGDFDEVLRVNIKS